LTLIDTLAFVLSLKPALEPYLNHEAVNYAYVKAIEIVAKSMLSKCLPFTTQDELTQFVAQKM